MCYVCGTVQPGFEGATAADLERFDDALAKKAEQPDTPKKALIGIIVGWLVVFLLLLGLLVWSNLSLKGPGH